MKAYQIRLHLAELPTIWRRIIVPSHVTFHQLHLVIQFAMGWDDMHLYEFWSTDDPTRYTDDQESIETYEWYLKNAEEPHDEWTEHILSQPLRSSVAKIGPVLESNGELTYMYDFGDSWEHQIILEEILPNHPQAFASVIEAGEACPPEDVGGPTGYLAFLESWYNPRDPEHAQNKAWGEMMGFTGSFDRNRANLSLEYKLPFGKDEISKLAFEVNNTIFHANVPLAFRTDIDAEAISTTHLYKYFKDFLAIIKESEPLKLTAKGNLPAKLVATLSTQGYDYLSPRLPDKVVREDQAWFIAELHYLARDGGLVLKRRNQLTLTKKGSKIMDNPVQLYLFLWKSSVRRYATDYSNGYGLFHPIFLGYLLELLHKYGHAEREISFYVERLLSIHPYLIEEYSDSDYAEVLFMSRLFRTILSDVFAELGIAETRKVKKKDSYDYDYYVRTTDLFEQVLVSW